jgi:Polyketide cyclase / dehydrase and lipid transport
MPVIEAEALVAAPAEEVFKVLHDPTRHPEWWVGVDTVEGVRRQDDALRFWVDSRDHPGIRLEQRQEPLAGGGIVMTCLRYGIRFRWRLIPEGDATRVHAHVEIPDYSRELTDGYRTKIPASLERLTTLCKRSA